MFAVLGVIGMIILLIFVLPIISFWLSYFGGWVASVVIGKQLCFALNTLFNSDWFTPDKLPWMAGALGWIGGFFKSVTTNTKKKN